MASIGEWPTRPNYPATRAWLTRHGDATTTEPSTPLDPANGIVWPTVDPDSAESHIPDRTVPKFEGSHPSAQPAHDDLLRRLLHALRHL